MIYPGKLNRFVHLRLLIILLVSAVWISVYVFSSKPADANQAGINFSFTLDSSCSTSAGVYSSNGTLIRTLWRGLSFPAGLHSYQWDGLEDDGSTAPDGTYQIRVLYHNVRYIWDGVIGNTSSSFTAARDTIHRGFNDVAGLGLSGKNVYYTTGYDENLSGVKEFNISHPETPLAVSPINTYVCYNYIAADNTKWYLANTGEGRPGAPDATFVCAFNVSDNSSYQFPDGATAKPSGGISFTGVADVATGDHQLDAATGLAVQTSGNLLAVSHGPLNVVRLLDKETGASIGQINIENPQEVAFDSKGALWVISGNRVDKFTNAGKSNTPDVVLVGLDQPLGLAANSSVILVADGGSSDQLKAFHLDGSADWIFGQVGGYAANGPIVANDKFQFALTQPNVDNIPMVFVPDGSFWVADGANHRLLHFGSDRSYIEQIAYVPCSYAVAVDVNNPTRVFANFLEFHVDYSKPLMPGDPSGADGNGCWKLVKNWGQNLSDNYYDPPFGENKAGLVFVATLSNGRTYGLLNYWAPGQHHMTVVELAASGLRPTGINLTPNESMYADGSLRYSQITAGMQTVFLKRLTGFDRDGNPIWDDPEVIASSPSGTIVPVESPGEWNGSAGPQLPITSSGIVVSYNTTTPYNPSNVGVDTGMHLGGVREGTDTWLWMTFPAVNSDYPMIKDGRFDLGDHVTYAGNSVMTAGHNIICGYHGEFWEESEANQFMHFWDDGLFVGQFGEPNNNRYETESIGAGQAGNAFSPTLVTANGELYLYHNDEFTHSGIHRWHLVGVNDIREESGTGVLGSTITLAVPETNAPSHLDAKSSNGSVELNWKPVARETYDVKVAITSGGPYKTVATGVNGDTYRVTGLDNEQPYYFRIATSHSIRLDDETDEIRSEPFDKAILVHLAGQMTDGDLGHNVIGLENADGVATLTDLDDLKGDLSLYKIGSEGFIIFDFEGPGNPVSNLPEGLQVEIGQGWTHTNNISNQFTVNQTKEALNPSANCLCSDPVGRIDIVSSDHKWHYLTVFSPAKSTNDRDCSISLTTAGSSTPGATFRIVETYSESAGRNHVIQFLFYGNVTLTVNSPTKMGGNIQALFFDPAPG